MGGNNRPNGKLTVLDYSCPAEEDRRDRAIVDEHLKTVGDYNQATFGERHPFSVWRNVVFVLLVSALCAFLPRWARVPTMLVSVVLFNIRESRL